MYQYFVYLKLSENRLVIFEKPMNNNDYFILMNIDGGDRELLINYVKMFCMGIILGGTYGKQVINTMQEFQ